MTEPENLVLTLLRELRSRMDVGFNDLGERVSALNERVSAVEEHLANTRADIAGLRRDIAIDAKMRVMLMRKVDEHSAKLTSMNRVH